MRIVAAVCALLSLAACQPTVLRTETRFVPPTEPGQLACVGRCDQADRGCLSGSSEPQPLARSGTAKDHEEAERIRREYDECSKRVQAEYEQCEMRARTDGGRGTCYKPVCLVDGQLPTRSDEPAAAHGARDEASCARRYRACYQRCGGRVETVETCEANC